MGDEKKVKVVNLTGHFNFKMTEGITTGIKFDAATYNNMILEKPFHRPNLIASWSEIWFFDSGCNRRVSL